MKLNVVRNNQKHLFVRRRQSLTNLADQQVCFEKDFKERCA